MTLLISCIVAWLICATISASCMLAFAQNKFCTIAEDSYREDLATAWGLSLMAAPISLVVTFFMTGFYKYGFMNPFVLNKYKE